MNSLYKPKRSCCSMSNSYRAMLYPPNLSCTVSELPGKGRSLVANVPFAPSEVISSESCYSFALSKEYSEVACTFCCHLCINEPIYGSADSSRYCSLECSQNDNEMHEYEMKIMKMLKVTVFELNADRLLVRALVSKYFFSTKALGRSADDVDILQHGVSADESVELCDANPTETKFVDTLAKILSILLSMKRKQEGVTTSVGLGGSVTIKREDVLKVKYAIQCNAHGVVPVQLENQEQPAGLALFPHTCMINHDCGPNAIQHFLFERKSVPRIVIRAVRAIGVGEEICYNYVPLLLTSPSRQQLLSHSYGFDCTCKKCSCHKASAEGSDSPLLLLTTPGDSICFLNDKLMEYVSEAASPTELALWHHQCSQLIQESADQLNEVTSACKIGSNHLDSTMAVYPLSSSVVESLDSLLFPATAATAAASSSRSTDVDDVLTATTFTTFTSSPAAVFGPFHSVTFQLHCVYGDACLKSALLELSKSDSSGANVTLLEMLRILRSQPELSEVNKDYLRSHWFDIENGTEQLLKLRSLLSRASVFNLLVAAYVLGFAGHGRLYCCSRLRAGAHAMMLLEHLCELANIVEIEKSSQEHNAIATSAVAVDIAITASSVEHCLSDFNSSDTSKIGSASVASLRGLSCLDYPQSSRPWNSMAAVTREPPETPSEEAEIVPGSESEPEREGKSAGYLNVNDATNSKECFRLVEMMLGKYTCHGNDNVNDDETAGDTSIKRLCIATRGQNNSFLCGYIHADSSSTHVLLSSLIQWILDRYVKEGENNQKVPLSTKIAQCAVDETARCRGADSAQVRDCRKELQDIGVLKAY